MSKRRITGSNRGGRNGYEIGYGKPPKHSQFCPGQSGYPAGRRKGLRNLKTDVKSTLAIPVKVKEGGRTRTRSTQECALMVLREKALRGEVRAIVRLLELADRFNSDAAQIGSQPLSSDDQAILAAYGRQDSHLCIRDLARRARRVAEGRAPDSSRLVHNLPSAKHDSSEGSGTQVSEAEVRLLPPPPASPSPSPGAAGTPPSAGAARFTVA